MYMLKRLRFGPAGKPIDYKKADITGVPEFLKSIGLDAFEYEAVRGVKISEAKALKLGEEAKKNDVVMSLHAPYYINLSSKVKETVEKSKRWIVEAVKAANWMNAYVVVFHPGYYKGVSQSEAVKMVIKALNEVNDIIRNQLGIKNVWLGPETTGKKSQVGSVDEVIEICKNVGKCRPVIDWAHIYARSLGMFITVVDHVVSVIDKIEKELGTEVLKPLHMHFSRISYGSSGEKEHHVLSDVGFGPEFKIVCKGLKQVGIEGVIISESPILEKDALVMKRICCEEEEYC